MSSSATSRIGSTGEPDVVVTVVRGHTQQVSHVFEQGQEAPPFSVGSNGDWSVSGPGVVPIHLWLRFDGRQLYAAAGDGAVLLQGRALSQSWSALQDQAELRFGFALVRVGRERQRDTSAKERARPTRMMAGIALGVVLTSTLAVALIFATKGSPARPTAEVAAASAPSASPPAPALPITPPALPEPAAPRNATLTERLAQLPAEPPPPLLEPTSLPAGVAATPEQPVPLLKPPPAYRQNVANRPIPRIGEKPWLIAEAWRAHHERLLHAPGRATAKIIFVGDSITEGWGAAPAYREHFGKYSPLNLGLAGDTTQNVLWRIEHGALDGTQPRVVVLLVGINNLAGGFSPEQTSEGVRAVVTAIQTRLPTARVLLLAVLPARQDPANPLRESIKHANRLLANLAKPGRVELHDVGSVLLEPDGTISKAMLRDFVHPTPAGFEKLSQATAPLLDSLMAHAGN
jgi:lysophospholipase L1-like esterase